MYACSWLVSHVTDHVTMTLLLAAETTNEWNEDDANADQSYGSRSRNGNRALQQGDAPSFPALISIISRRSLIPGGPRGRLKSRK